MTDYKYPEKKIFIIKPDNLEGLISAKLELEKRKIVPPGNIPLFNNHEDALARLNKGEHCDLILFDAITLQLLKSYEDSSSHVWEELDPSYEELNTEKLLMDQLEIKNIEKYNFAEAASLLLKALSDHREKVKASWFGLPLDTRYFFQKISDYKGAWNDFRGLVFSFGPLDNMIDTVKPVIYFISEYLRFYGTSKGPALDTNNIISSIDEALDCNNFMEMRTKYFVAKKIREEADKAIIKATIEKVLNDVAVTKGPAGFENFPKRQMSSALPDFSDLNEAERKMDIGDLLKNSETMIIHMEKTKSDFDVIIYLRKGYSPLDSSELSLKGKPSLIELPATMQFPSRPDNNYPQNVASICVDADLRREGVQRYTLSWIKEISQWLGMSQKRVLFSPEGRFLDVIADAYKIPLKRVAGREILSLSPFELISLANNLGRDDNKEFLRRVLVDMGFKEEVDSEWFNRNIDTIELMPSGYQIERGYTGLGVLINRDWAIKFDEMPRIGNEHYVLANLDLGDFSFIVPKVRDKGFTVTEDGKYGALVLENLNNRSLDGFTLSIRLAQKYGLYLQDGLSTTLFMMGMFHKYANRDEKLKGNIKPVLYEDKRGIIHSISANIPQDGITGEAYRRFNITSIPVGEVVGLIDSYNKQIKALGNLNQLSVIHGDWKPENIVKGYLVDFAMLGLAHEVDEMAYFLSDYRAGISLSDFHSKINDYTVLRSRHDTDFQVKMQYNGKKEMHTLADSSFLRQLVLRHSVMKKRNMLDDDKFMQRQYYQHRIKEILKEGRFV